MKAVVIGAGFGGLSSAAYLAKQGYDVTILEKNNWVGGRVRTHVEKNYRFDLGPSWYLMPEEFDNWFDSLGYKRTDFYEIKRVDPSYKVFFDDDILEIPANKDAVIELFNSIEPGSGGRLQKLLHDAARDYKYLVDNIAQINTNDLFSKLSVSMSVLKNIGISRILKSYRARIQEVARDHRLQKILEYPAIFLGSTPKKLSAPATILSHVDFTLGTWYPIGGFSIVANSMAKVARELGVHIVLNSEVENFEFDNKEIKGVSTAHKTYIADVVVANADRHFVDQMLLPKSKRDFKDSKWETADISHGVLNLYLGVKDNLDNFETHNFFFDAPWEEHFNSFEQERWPMKPVFYTHCPSKIDPAAAPSNCNAIFALVPIAAGLIDTYNERAVIVSKIIDRMSQYCNTNLSSAIEVEKIMSLNDFEKDYNAYLGNAFGLSMTFKQTSVFRMPNKAKRVRNLYYAGHYTNPGTGLGMSLLSGKLAARQAMYDTQ